MKKITVTITPDGESKIEAAGYSGDECIKDTKPLEEALGVTGERTRKLEANTVAVTTFNKAGQK